MLLDRQQSVEEAGELVAASYSARAGFPTSSWPRSSGLLREDPGLPHDTVRWRRACASTSCCGGPVRSFPLIAAARYLAAHAPTPRSQHQTYDIARRLHRGERVYEEEPAPPEGEPG